MKKKIKSIAIISIFLISSLSLVTTSNANKINQINSETNIIEMIQEVEESSLYYYHSNLVDYGPRYTGSINCNLAGQYIYDEFEEMGLDVEFHEWNYAGFHSRNIVATLPGTDINSNSIFLMTAHYDTVEGAPGADDDASGVAVVLETARVLSQYSFNHTIRFIAFSGEEVATLGSYAYAKEAYNREDNIVAVINADMVGYADSTEGGKIIRFSNPERSVWISEFAEFVSDKYLEIVDMQVQKIPNYLGADHQPFIDYGYDGVWIVHRDGYSWGHSPEDTIDHINFTYETKATKFLLAVVAELAKKPIDIQVVLKTPYEGYAYFFNRPILQLSFVKQWYLGLRGATFILGRAIASVDVYSKEEIEQVIFCMDGKFISWDSEPPYEWKIQGKYSPTIGRHTLKVYAYTKSGKIASDEMDIRMLSLSYQYGIV